VSSIKAHRDTIYVEEAEILSHQSHAGDQYTLRLQAPKIAAHALPGSFVHLTVNAQRPMRRPISILRVDAKKGYVDLLYKVFGEGTALLAQNKVGESLNLMGPIGKPFEFHPERTRPLLIGGGVGMPPMIFIAEALRDGEQRPFVVLGSEVPFPFRARPSQFVLPGIPEGVIAAMPLLEDWGIPSRLASQRDFAGCHQGYVTDLARRWLDGLSEQERAEVGIYACGPHPMLEAVVAVARDYALPVQVSLEEFMACAVGGCAGCVVEVKTANGPAMQRVCVDGPVFDGYAVF
jgi:dihydroorotate dehydrogenase electron transfer subunit